MTMSYSRICHYKSRNSANVMEAFTFYSPLALASMLFLDGVPPIQARFLADEAFAYGVGYRHRGQSPTGKNYLYQIEAVK